MNRSTRTKSHIEKVIAARLRQGIEEQALAVLSGYPIGTNVNTAGRVEKVVKGERVGDDEPPRLEHKET